MGRALASRGSLVPSLLLAATFNWHLLCQLEMAAGSGQGTRLLKGWGDLPIVIQHLCVLSPRGALPLVFDQYFDCMPFTLAVDVSS